MNKRHKLFVVIDPTTSEQPALARAVEFGRHLDVDLVLFCCIFNSDIAHVEWVTGDKLEHLRSAALDEQFKKLENLAAPLRKNGLQVSLKVAWDRPLHEAIVREAIAIEPDFVIKDTHHHSALSRALLTNTDWHLIRECPYPLWLVKPGATSPEATVMAAVDPTHAHDQTTELDHSIIQTAQLISVMYEERLHLLHVFEPPPSLITEVYPASASLPEMNLEALRETAQQAHAEVLDKLAADSGFPADQVHLREGNQVELLPSVAKELHANIVVMGAVARSALQRAIIGHTAELTLEKFECDVVIVKSSDFESPIAALPPIYGYTARTG